MSKIVNRAKMTVSGTPGTGTITLGSAASGFQTFADAGVLSGDTVNYVLEDGAAWEYGTGLFNGTTLTRAVLQSSEVGSAPISATSAATVYITLFAQDVAPFDGELVQDGDPVNGSNPLAMELFQDGTAVGNNFGLRVKPDNGTLWDVKLHSSSSTIYATNPPGSPTSVVLSDNSVTIDGTVEVLPEFNTATIGSATINGGATPVVLSSATAKAVDIVNNSAVDLEYRRNATGTYMILPSKSGRIIIGLSNANEVGLRRVDLSSTAITVTYEVLT